MTEKVLDRQHIGKSEVGTRLRLPPSGNFPDSPDAEEGKSPSTQAGEFVREEIEHIREGKHGARSTKQAIAIGLSKARRAGVQLKPRQNFDDFR